jgi:hypothetical protein
MRAGRELRLAVVMTLVCVSAYAQAPQPFPKPTQPAPTTPPARPSPPTPVPGRTAASDVPTEAMLGAPIYPGAQFITSYEAGRGQRFYLFGVGAPFVDMVSYYRTALKQRGEVLFESPPTHQFDTGRFREEVMAFPPSVTIKDYTWGGSAGYPNPKREAQPPHFATIIQIVAAPSATP